MAKKVKIRKKKEKEEGGMLFSSTISFNFAKLINKILFLGLISFVPLCLLMFFKLELENIRQVNFNYTLESAAFVENIYCQYQEFYKLIANDLEPLTADKIDFILKHILNLSKINSGAYFLNSKGKVIKYIYPGGEPLELKNSLNIVETEFFQSITTKRDLVVTEPIRLSYFQHNPVILLGFPIYDSQGGFQGGFFTTICTNKFYQVLMEKRPLGTTSKVVIDLIPENRNYFLSAFDQYRNLHRIEKNTYISQWLDTKGGRGKIFFHPEYKAYYYGSAVKVEGLPYYLSLSQPFWDLFFQDYLKYLKGFLVSNLLVAVFISSIFYLWFLKKKKSNESFLSQEKLCLISEVAAGAADGILNPLASIRGFLDLMMEKNFDPRNLRLLKFLSLEVDKIEGKIKELMLLAKPYYRDEVPIRINDLIQEIINEYQFSDQWEGYNFVLDCCQSLPELLVNPFEIKQMLKYIIQNAVESMPQGGEIKISCFKSDLEKKVIIVVRDKGIGMDKKTLAKIFSPFFSTKAGHLGLGLYVSKQIIASYGGEIAITSMVGKGTKAVINLPLR
ncbi:MAG TPA: hypothetical protein GXX38_04260 [Clostridia bacterium]|nr:hypothetical protein [Clostridia bacterium]